MDSSQIDTDIAGTKTDTRHFSENAVKKAGSSDIKDTSHTNLYYKDEFVAVQRTFLKQILINNSKQAGKSRLNLRLT